MRGNNPQKSKYSSGMRFLAILLSIMMLSSIIVFIAIALRG